MSEPAFGTRPTLASTLSRRATLLLAAAPVGFLGVFFFWPLATILWRGVSPEGSPDLAALAEIVTDPRWWRVAWFTTWQATISTAVTLAVGLPVAGVLARYRIRGQRLLRGALTVPFVMPTVVVATAFIALLDLFGGAGRSVRDSVVSIIVAHVFFNIAVVVRIVSEPWSRLAREIDDVARVLGRGPFGAWSQATLPRLRRTIASAAAIVFLFSFTSFGVVLLLGNPSTSTLEVETYIQTTAFLRLDVAAVLALMQLTIVSALLIGQRRLNRRAVGQVVQVQASNQRRVATSLTERIAIAATLCGAIGFVSAPLLVLAFRSIRINGQFSLDNYRQLNQQGDALLVTPLEAIANSVGFGVAAMLLAVVIGTLAAVVIVHGHGGSAGALDIALMLPLGTSAVTVGFGMLIALDKPPLDLRTSIAIIPIAHALVGIPFVIRILVPSLRAVDDRLRQSAQVLGTSKLQVWRRVDLPILSRSFMAAAGFAFAVSLGEFGATSFIVRPDRPTLPTAVVRLLARPGSTNFGQAMAMATILMAATIAAVVIIESFRVGDAGDF